MEPEYEKMHTTETCHGHRRVTYPNKNSLFCRPRKRNVFFFFFACGDDKAEMEKPKMKFNMISLFFFNVRFVFFDRIDDLA